MTHDDAIEALEEAWGDEDGFIYRLRMGEYRPQFAAELVALLRAITAEGEDLLPRRLVSLLWFLFPFLEWNACRVDPGTVADIERVKREVEGELIRILGVP